MLKKLSSPTRLHTTARAAGGVVLAWRKVSGAVAYEVLRDGKVVRRTKKTRFTDRAPVAGRSYRYAVRAVDKKGRRSKASAALKVAVPRPAGSGPGFTPGPTSSGVPIGPGANTGGTPAPAPVVPDPAPDPSATILTAPMVTRLFWRAGFGPLPADLAEWTGKTHAALVDHLLDTAQTLDPAIPTPKTQTNGEIVASGTTDEFIMEWLDTMVRANNPLIERMTFFWHRHFAVNASDGVGKQVGLQYRNRLRGFGDLATNPDATFRQLALEMTTQDGAMSFFLNNASNRKNNVNENYAREFMELFCLGVRDDAGAFTYTQNDVHELARAFTGWNINQTPGADFGKVSFVPNRFDGANKTIFGQTANWGALPVVGAGAQSAIDLVLAQPSHAPFLLRKLWAEFIVTPVPADTLADLVATYTAGGGLKIKPVLRKILMHPLIFESLDEPNMVKPPVVFYVGAMRQLQAPQKWFHSRESLERMQQVPYYPPNVAGWEGGLSWLNTNTTQARFDAILRLLMLKHRPSPNPTSSTGFPGAVPIPTPAAGETDQQAFDTAYAACNAPWLSAATRARIVSFAGTHGGSTANLRLQRQYALRAVILGGPDNQVM